ncbi:MAG TPA: arsenate reductase (glutaredoxin) [Bacteroidia bacterium]|nr:arsenate reductase (glutaredoxin) [Bacteroidia bacterium]
MTKSKTAKLKAELTPSPLERAGVRLYHNTRCSKSREVCTILEKKKVKTEVVEYLKTPPTQKEIIELLKMLGMKAVDLVRKKEPLFLEKYEGKKLTEAQWIKAMAQNPILIERPIIVKGKKAIIGRPPEKVLEFI